MLSIFATVFFSLLIFVGVFMTLVPMLPAIFYMFVLSVIFSIVSGFTVVTPAQLAVLGAILILGFLNDMFSGILGAKWSGASGKSIFYGFVGLIIGILILPPFGGIAGLFAGVLIAELLLGKTHSRAFKAASGSVIGAIAGMLINFILATFFFVLFLIFIIF